MGQIDPLLPFKIERLNGRESAGMRSSAEGVDCANVSLHDQDPIGGLADAPTPLPTAWTMIWRRWRGFREWHREPLRASLWRQKVDVVKGREPKDFGHVGESVQRLEQILELSGRRDPEEHPGPALLK